MSGVMRTFTAGFSPVPRAPNAPPGPAEESSLPAAGLAPPAALGRAGRAAATAATPPACAAAIGGCALNADRGPPDDATDTPVPGGVLLCALSRPPAVLPTRISLRRAATCLALP